MSATVKRNALARLRRLQAASEDPKYDATDISDRYQVALFDSASDLFDLAEEALRLRPALRQCMRVIGRDSLGDEAFHAAYYRARKALGMKTV